METETGSETAKPESNLRKVLSVQDILDGNISHDTGNTAVTPYTGDAAMTAAMLKYSDEERLNIANAVRKAVSSIDMPTLHDYTDVLTQLRNSTSAMKELNSFAYLNEATSYPTRPFPLSSSAEPLEVYFEPIPKGGIECVKFYATGGTAVQVGNVLYDEFAPLKEPLCFLIPHNDSNDYWHIFVFDGDVSEAREWHIAGQDVEDYQEYLTYGGQDKVKRIGYVYVSDRPKIQVIFYVYDEADGDLVKSLGHRAANELEQSGFDLTVSVVNESSLPDGATMIDDFDEVLLGTTTLELANLVSAYLQVEGHVAESVSLERKIYNGKICVQYPFSDCIIRLKTQSKKLGETNVQPDVHCWESNPIKREQYLSEAKNHIVDLIGTLKKQARWMPQKPLPIDHLDRWFDYYHQCKAAGIKIRMKDIGIEIGLTEGHLLNEHGKYKAERNL